MVENSVSARGASNRDRAPTILTHRIPTTGSNPYIIVPGSDGALWFCDQGASKIGRYDPRTAEFTSFDIPTSNSQPVGIIEGPDKAFWFTEQAGNKIGRITPDGTITEFTVPTANA